MLLIILTLPRKGLCFFRLLGTCHQTSLDIRRNHCCENECGTFHIVVKVKVSLVQLFVIPWTIACPAPLSMEFSRQQYWSGLPFPSPGDLPNPGIEPRSPASQTDSSPTDSVHVCVCKH